jgi:hypothetical protein
MKPQCLCYVLSNRYGMQPLEQESWNSEYFNINLLSVVPEQFYSRCKTIVRRSEREYALN